jgi:hypothetical protein
MTEDGAGGQPGADAEGRRHDFARTLLVVALTAAVVIVLVAPASRDLRPSTLLADASAVGPSVRSVDLAPATITSSARRERRPVDRALALDALPAASEPTARCVPCLPASSHASRPRTTSTNPASGAPGDDRPAPTKAGGGAAPTTTAAVPAGDNRPGGEPPTPSSQLRTPPKAGPTASAKPAPAASTTSGDQAEGPGRSGQHAGAADPAAGDRANSQASRTDDAKAKR